MTRLVIKEALIMLSTIVHRNQDIRNSLRVSLKIQVPFVHLHTVSKDVTLSAFAFVHWRDIQEQNSGADWLEFKDLYSRPKED